MELWQNRLQDGNCIIAFARASKYISRLEEDSYWMDNSYFLSHQYIRAHFDQEDHVICIFKWTNSLFQHCSKTIRLYKNEFPLDFHSYSLHEYQRSQHSPISMKFLGNRACCLFCFYWLQGKLLSRVINNEMFHVLIFIVNLFLFME